MKKYMGVQFINATPMNLGDYNTKRGWTIPADENPLWEGYFVELLDGRVTWLPKVVFEATYRETDGKLTFGLALAAAQKGKKIAREGWDGTGMFAVYSPGTTALPAENFFSPALKEYVGKKQNPVMNIRSALMLKTAQEDIAYWSPSASDALAEDWMIID
jgi:hypothetical protein